MKKIEDYKIGEVVDVFHWGKPEKMKVAGFCPQRNKIEMAYIDGPFGGCFYSPEELETMEEKVNEYYRRIPGKYAPELGFEIGDQTDCMGNSFSDADPGL